MGQVRKEFAVKSLASKTAHEESVAATKKELQRLQEFAIEAIMLGKIVVGSLGPEHNRAHANTTHRHGMNP